MSWAEVKKINSDLSIPLNKYLNGISPSFVASKFSSAETSLENISLVDINGEGLLYDVLARPYIYTSGSGFTVFTLKIVIDDDTVYDVTVEYGTSNQRRTMGIINIDDIGYNKYHFLHDADYNGDYYYGNAFTLDNNNPVFSGTYDTTINCQYVGLITNAIHFKNHCHVFFNATSQQGTSEFYYSAEYALI